MTRIASFKNPKNHLKTISKVPSKTKKMLELRLKVCFGIKNWTTLVI
jgi:hypothetical protein